MARVEIYQNQVQDQGVTNARQSSANFGPGIGEAVERAGNILSKVVDQRDQIEDVNARVEANRLAVEHSEHVRELSNKVRQSLGENAEGTAEEAIKELQGVTTDVMGRASPRARLLLQSELTQRSGIATDSWLDHGFRQKGEALETSSVARISRVVEDAADIDDEDAAKALLMEVGQLNKKRADFFGKGDDWRHEEDFKAVSEFYKSRALKLAQGQSGSASAAIAYAEKNREFLNDDDYNQLVGAYDDAATDEAVTAAVYGGNPVGAAVEKPADPEDGGPPSRLDPIQFFKAFVSPHEGSALVVDSNGAKVKYGVNAAYHKGENIAGMTEDRAAQIFRDKYYIPSGADKLAPALAALHADTYWLNQKQAMKILKESKGDVDKYAELRSAFLNGLASKNPAKYGKYQVGWEKRTRELKAYADRQGSDGTPLPAFPMTPGTNLDAIRTSIMQRTDIGIKMKRKMISTLEGRRSEMLQERALAESETDRAITQTTLALGENFTDVKQIPSNLWINASPTTRKQFTDMAKNNRENKPLTPQVAAEIGYLQTFKPQAFADPKVQQELIKKGVPTRIITQLAESAGKAMGTQHQVSREALEGVARPAFEAMGINLWTTESKKGDKNYDREQREDPAKQANLLSYLDMQARSWAAANPGKIADEATMKKWVGSALVTVQNGQAFGTLSNHDLTYLISPTDRQAIVSTLRNAGIQPTESEVANMYRQLRIARGK